MPVCPRCGIQLPADARYCLGCGLPLQDGHGGAPPTVSRRTVTVLFSDVVGSTALGERLEPEALRLVMTRYFAVMSAVLEHHGGTVEKFIGDAIMAVFGIPVLHEDDATRASRAALGMRDALRALNMELANETGITITVRTGVHTGPVVAGDASTRQRLVTGDAVNVAARLEQAAGPGEILLSEDTWRLARDAIRVEHVQPVAAKGKSTPVPAVRLIALATTAGADRIVSLPFVGRATELAHARALYRRVVRSHAPARLTLLGTAGLGKTRLLGAFLDGLHGEALVVRGRCPEDGVAATWWSMQQVVADAAGATDDADPTEVVAKLERLLGDDPESHSIRAVLGRAFGLAPGFVELAEVTWAVRRSLEVAAGSRPLVVVVEDLHRAPTPVLDLLDGLLDGVGDRALLVVGTARPDLLDMSTDRAGRPDAELLRLSDLDAEAVDMLIREAAGGVELPPDLRARIAEAAAGNPLFVVEMSRAAADELRSGSVGVHGREPVISIPPTIGALLSARIDRLPSAERAAAQRAGVIGIVFDEAGVAVLTPEADRSSVAGSLQALVRRDVVTQGRATSADVDYRFRHASIRDAAYDSLLKSELASLHERIATWLEVERPSVCVTTPAAVGHHLEVAWRCRSELLDDGLETMEIGRRAARWLVGAAAQARDGADPRSAISLYERAERLPSPGPRFRARLLLELGRTLHDLDRLAEARVHAVAALELAEAQREPGLRAQAQMLCLDIALIDGSRGPDDPALDDELRIMRRDAERSGDPHALTEVWRWQAAHAYERRRFAECRRSLEVARGHALLTSDERLIIDVELDTLLQAYVGPTPAGDLVTMSERLLDRTRDRPSARAMTLRLACVPAAMLGDHDRALRLADEAIGVYQALGQEASAAAVRMDRAAILRLADDDTGAERELRRALAAGEHLGQAALVSWAACRLAEALVGQGRVDEASAMATLAAHDINTLMRVRIDMVRVRVRAMHGEPGVVDEVRRIVSVLDDGHLLQKTDLLMEAAEATLAVAAITDAFGYARGARQLALSKENHAQRAQIDALIQRIEEGATRVRPA